MLKILATLTSTPSCEQKQEDVDLFLNTLWFVFVLVLLLLFLPFLVYSQS